MCHCLEPLQGQRIYRSRETNRPPMETHLGQDSGEVCEQRIFLEKRGAVAAVSHERGQQVMREISDIR